MNLYLNSIITCLGISLATQSQVTVQRPIWSAEQTIPTMPSSQKQAMMPEIVPWSFGWQALIIQETRAVNSSTVLLSSPFDDMLDPSTKQRVRTIDNRGFLWRCPLASGTMVARWSGQAPGDYFGYSLGGGGDADQNGVLDVLIGAPGAANGQGQVMVMDPVSGNQVSLIPAPPATSGFGACVTYDPFPGGVRCLVLAQPIEVPGNLPESASTQNHRTACFLYDLKKAGQIVSREFPKGDRVAVDSLQWIKDQNNDGESDIIIGLPDSQGMHGGASGRIEILSGIDLSVIGTIVGTNANNGFGFALAVIGAGDGAQTTRRLVVGCPYMSADGSAIGGLEQYDLSKLESLPMETNVRSETLFTRLNSMYGSTVVNVGDRDLDGWDDLCVGAPRGRSSSDDDDGWIGFVSGRTQALSSVVDSPEDHSVDFQEFGRSMRVGRLTIGGRQITTLLVGSSGSRALAHSGTVLIDLDRISRGGDLRAGVIASIAFIDQSPSVTLHNND